MIDLFSIKKYNDYDYIQDSLPSEDGSWLCSLTDSTYTRGYSYTVASGAATRTNVVQDTLILAKIYPMIEGVCANINNWFYLERQNSIDIDYSGDDFSLSVKDYRDFVYYESDSAEYTMLDGVISNLADNTFEVGDYIRIKSTLRNNLMSAVTDSTDDTITVDNDNLRNTTEYGLIFLCNIPSIVQDTISQMINYDMNYRDNPSDMQSESIGNYSYTKDTSSFSIGGLSYPLEHVSVLRSFRRANFIA